jgi:hypothetical protein
MKRRAILFTFFIFWTLSLIANIGQPGIWKAGGGISLLIPNDSLASKYIKMSSERVDFFVFTGFGIVNGHYTFTNTSDSKISFTMGYPINAIWRGEADNEPFGYSFRIDSLAGFEVTIDGYTEVPYPQILELSDDALDSDNWLVWEIDFAPGQTREINVTYTTPTKQTKVTNTKGQRKAHGLMYVFESGSVWKDKIDKAELFVHFMDGLTTEDVIGVRPCDQILLLKDKDKLYFNKSNWEPEPGENFYLLYQSRKNKYYSFPEGVQDRNQLYSQIQKKGKEGFQVTKSTIFTCQDILDIDTKSRYAPLVFSILGASLLLFILLIYIIIKLINKLNIDLGSE